MIKQRKKVFVLFTLIFAIAMFIYVTDAGSIDYQQEEFLEENDQDRIVVPQEEAVTRVNQEVGPSVVSIITKDITMSDDFFFSPIPEEREGIGSGIIFDESGYILTNNHVIDNADELWVLYQEERVEAEIIGNDPQSDLAVLKIDKDDLPAAEFGDSSNLAPGQLAIAIGSPFGAEFSNTVTTGVVSALEREISTTDRGGRNIILDGLIQTDASINPGNSGGPLLDSQGKVIGINTAIIGRAEGIGFAIPINQAQEIIDDLIEHGRVQRPWLGIYGTKLTSELSEYYKLSVDNGVMILRVAANSPASEAGLSDGDVIVEADEQRVNDMDELREIIESVGIGNSLQLLILSGEDLTPITVELEEMPE